VALALAFLVGMNPQPASAQSGVDTVTYFCNGIDNTAGMCNVFQLDGSQGTPNGDTCVGGESICPAAEQNPSWPADWDSLFFPALTKNGAAGVPVTAGSPPGAYSFSLPWNTFGSFSGVIPSTLVTNNISTILKQGSKNNNDISTWTVSLQSSPPKDAYLAGTIADFIAPTGSAIAGHQLVYLGSTRFAPNGSATIGIWFFQQNVEVCKTGPNAGTKFCVAGTQTLATHQNKDLFLFLTFSGGGDATIVPAEWQNGTLVQNSALTTCPSSGAQGCAVTNNVTSITLGNSTGHGAGANIGFNVSGPGWPGFPAGVVPVNQFQETGVDFNAIFGGVAPCFSSVMFASVSSGSSPGTASLKSILLGSFNTCAISVNKTCGTGAANVSTGTITYPINGTVENVGGGTTSNLSLSDTFNNVSQAFDSGSLTCTCGATGCTITGTNCSTVSLSPGGSVTYNATITTTNNGGSDIVNATMGGSGGGSASAQSNTATCQTLSFKSGINITKSCSPGATLVAKSGLVAVQVGVGGTVSASADDQFTLTNVTVYDCVGGSWTTANPDPTVAANCTGTIQKLTGLSDLAPGGTDPWSDSYFPTVAPTCGPYNFTDTAVVTATCNSNFCPGGKGTTVQNISNAAICPLCPGPTCP
jgi:hypothetical protein